MPENHTIEFTNGVASAVTLPVGIYTYVSNTIPGYSEGSVAEFEVTLQTTSIALELTANGTLTIVVKDDNDDPITAGEMQLTNTAGDIRFGPAVTISDTGSAVFENVPYTTDGIDLHYRQDTSDSRHKPLDGVQTVSMTTMEQSENVLNDRVTVTIPDVTAADATYGDMIPPTGNIVVNG